MKLVYIANLRIPTEKAYGIQIAKTCEAMADLGCSVMLLCPFRLSKIKDDFFNYYAIKRNFIFKKVFVLDIYLPGFLNKIAFGFKSFYSAVILVFYALIEGADIFYTRDELVAYIISFFRRNIIFEGHRFSSKRKIFYSRFKKINLKIVVISRGIKDDFIKSGIKAENLLIARDGVDLSLFNIDISKEEARKRYNLPLDRKIVMYSGHLFEWKGASLLLDAASQFQVSSPKSPVRGLGPPLRGFKFQNEILFVFVGGTDYDLKKFKQKAKGLNNVLILGYRPHDQVPSLLKAADVLVLPNSAKEEISSRYTSPLKLFEYMASKKPIIASNLPSIREVLNETNSFLVKSDNPHAFIGGLKKILGDSELAKNISNKAFQDVQQYTWHKRAEIIINNLLSLLL